MKVGGFNNYKNLNSMISIEECDKQLADVNDEILKLRTKYDDLQRLKSLVTEEKLNLRKGMILKHTSSLEYIIINDYKVRHTRILADVIRICINDNQELLITSFNNLYIYYEIWKPCDDNDIIELSSKLDDFITNVFTLMSHD